MLICVPRWLILMQWISVSFSKSDISFDGRYIPYPVFIHWPLALNISSIWKFSHVTYIVDLDCKISDVVFIGQGLHHTCVWKFNELCKISIHSKWHTNLYGWMKREWIHEINLQGSKLPRNDVTIVELFARMFSSKQQYFFLGYPSCSVSCPFRPVPLHIWWQPSWIFCIKEVRFVDPIH